MAESNRVTGTGDGTRPTTDGTVDNIGGGEKFTSKRNAAGEEISGGPAPVEQMGSKRKDVESTKRDDSAPFGLNEDLSPVKNKEDSR